jgi:hypothetical protein
MPDTGRLRLTRGHLTDGDLIDHLDAPEDSAAAAEHLGQCASCKSRLEVHRRRSSALGAVFSRHPEVAPEKTAVPRPRRIEPPVRWITLARAALLLLVVGTAAALPTVVRFVARLSEPPVTTEAPRVPDTVPARMGPVVDFAVAGDAFTITYALEPAGGSLILVSRDRETAAAQVVQLDAGESLVVLPSGLNVLSSRPSSGALRVELPARVRVVRVGVVGQDTARSLTLARGDSVTVRLPRR